MLSFEETIQAFYCCTQDPPYCENCPEQGPGFGIACVQDVNASVINWLRAQEPRTLTIEEVRKLTQKPVWLDCRRSNKYLYRGWALAYEVHQGMGISGERLGMADPSGRMHWYKLDDYGRTWRVWDSVPHDEQREAVKWE